LYIGIDPDAAAMAQYAFRAARKPARGGVDNVLFVVAAVEQLPPELAGLAARVHVVFPWGGLLRGLLRPEPNVVAALVSLARPDGRFEIVMTYDPSHDTGALASGEPLPALDAAYVDSTLAPAYAAAGLAVEAHRFLTREEALAIPSTWGRRLLHGRPRNVLVIYGTKS
jgi:16S rRNA (adenine(1408)-N(1))-methyltransferase